MKQGFRIEKKGKLWKKVLSVVLVLSMLFSGNWSFEQREVKAAQLSNIKGRTIFFLGSSVTYGSASGGVSFADYIASRNGSFSVKEAVSGTTLVDNGSSSYVQRLINNMDKGATPDHFICQLSTNDASQGKPLGSISSSTNKSDFDTSTIIGAMEYIIAYAQETWNCPVSFYTGTYYNSANYQNMVNALYSLKNKWGIGIIDLWNNEAMRNVSASDKARYMADDIHPTAVGYEEWWTPVFEDYLQNFDYSKYEATANGGNINENAIYTIVNVGTGKVLDIPNASSENNTKLQSYSSNRTAAQQFRVIKSVDDGYNVIIPMCAQTKAVDNPNYSGSAGTIAEIYIQQGNTAQDYKFEAVGNGMYRIINRSSNMALQDEGNIQQQPIADNNKQLWRVKVFRQTNTFTNPIRHDGADPWVVKAGDSYYLCQSAGGIGLYQFDDLHQLGIGRYTNIFTNDYQGSEFLSSYWAPELIYVRGRWYVYFAPEVNRGGNDSHRTYVLEGGTNPNNPFDGAYTLKGRLADWSADKWSIDTTVFEYNGRLYCVWSGWEGDTNVSQYIYIAEMSNPYTMSSNRVCIAVPSYWWETQHSPTVNEGPEVLVKDGAVHIIYSGSGSWTDDYCLARLTCTDGNILNPGSWTKTSEPVFQKTSSVFGPGHASFVTSKDGREDWIIYHAAKYSGGGWDRDVRMQFFTWHGNTPFFGEPVAGGVELGKPSSSGQAPVENGAYYRFVNVATGRSMDIPNAEDANSLQIQTWSQNDSDAQKFKVIEKSTGWYVLAPKCAEGRAIDNPSASVEKGKRFQTWEQNGHYAQNFRFEKLSDGTYRIINQASLFALTDKGEAGGYAVTQEALTNDDNQKWVLVKLSDSTGEPETEAPTEVPTEAPTEAPTQAPGGNGPEEVFGHLISATIPGLIDVVWGASTTGQTYNVYVDGNIATDINGATLRNIGCAAYRIPATGGTHTVRITSVLNGQESAGVSATVTVTAAAETESQTPASDGYVTAGANWNELNYWSVYFASGWANDPTGSYKDGGSYNDFGVRINTASNTDWGIQLRTQSLSVTEGKKYIARVSATSNMATTSQIRYKDEGSQTEKFYTLVAGNNDFEIEFTASTFAQIFFDLGQAPAGLDMKITSFSLEEVVPETEAPTEEPTEEPTTVITTIEGGIEINGYQVSSINKGMRTVYSVDSEINGKEVVASGMIYSLADYASESDMYIGSNHEFVRNFESTTNGVCPSVHSESDIATSYAMTMKFATASAYEYNTNWIVRAYAKLSDGTYVYTDCVEYTIYEVADKLYQEGLMYTQAAHEYLYTDILSVVNKDYAVKEYDFSNTLAK